VGVQARTENGLRVFAAVIIDVDGVSTGGQDAFAAREESIRGVAIPQVGLADARSIGAIVQHDVGWLGVCSRRANEGERRRTYGQDGREKYRFSWAQFLLVVARALCQGQPGFAPSQYV
jgi:hypothetical protein